MKIAALQLDPVWEDRQANYDKVRAFAARAREQQAEWLVLPEMFATGFSLNPALTVETLDGPTASFLKELARGLGLGVVGGLVLSGDGGKGRNAALAVDATGAELGLYVKTHLVSFMDEHRHHQAGTGPVIFDMGPCRAACMICYDLRFPELFRLVAEPCSLVMVIASWPAARQHHWDLLLPARAVENQCYLVGVNRVGTGAGLDYLGGSAIYDPLGVRLAHAGSSEALLVADLDPKQVDAVRRRLPVLRDRRFG